MRSIPSTTWRSPSTGFFAAEETGFAFGFFLSGLGVALVFGGGFPGPGFFGGGFALLGVGQFLVAQRTGGGGIDDEAAVDWHRAPRMRFCRPC